jgi:flagellar hook-associated protein 1 FlgK
VGVNFSPFEIGRRALRASQLGLAVAGQNIANVNTPGYTRQSVLLSATPGAGIGKTNLIGSGVSIDGVRQFRDRFVESRLQTETAIAGRFTAQRDALAPVDALFNESEGGGISAAMQSFFGSFTALEASPGSTALRNDVVAKAGSFVNILATTRARLTGIRSNTDGGLRDSVPQLNTLTAQVADMNVHIASAEYAGSSASELRDKRDALIHQVAELTGARSTEDQNGMVTLTLSDGQALVSGSHATELSVVNTPPYGLGTILLNGQPAAIGDGKIRGLQDALSSVQVQLGSLDDLAASIATRVNALHSSGTDGNGNAGVNFFEIPGSGPITAANLSVTAAIKSDSRLIVASPLPPPSSFGTVAGALGGLLTDSASTVGTKTGSYSSIYASIVSSAGSDMRLAEDGLATQQVILAQANAQRESVSGVSLDEEAINLLQFQRSYEAAARFLKIADELTQTILSLGN